MFIDWNIWFVATNFLLQQPMCIAGIENGVERGVPEMKQQRMSAEVHWRVYENVATKF